MISMIACIDNQNGLGKNNKLLFNIKEDLEWFKEVTLDTTIVMGRKTFESIGKPLNRRVNVVLTKDESYEDPDNKFIVENSVEDVLEDFKDTSELVVIGGEETYRMFMPYADYLYITEVNENKEADTYFPQIDENEWVNVYIKEGKREKGKEYAFKIYERKQ